MLVWVTHQARGSFTNCAVLIFRLIRDLFTFAPLIQLFNEAAAFGFWYCPPLDKPVASLAAISHGEMAHT